tara:strand:+ start:211 stop:1284 length:1074 start_codon:yes stop_codon:yes gene_type:complete
MAKLGHDVHIITSDRYAPFLGFKKTKERIVGCGEQTLDGFKIHRISIYFESRGRIMLKGLMKKIISLNPDLIILHGSTNFVNPIVLLNRKKLNAKIVIDEHHMTIIENKGLFAKLFYSIWGYFYRKLIKDDSISLVGVAPNCCEFLSNKYNIPLDQINYIPLGADTDLFYPNQEKCISIRKKLNINKDEILIIYTGKINEEKNPFLILKACLRSEELSNLKYIFIGNISEPYIEKNSQLISSKRVVVLPGLNNKELPDYYNAADIACWPKHASLSSIEAASCAVPIIVTKTVEERVSYGNGIAIKDENLQEIFQAIKKISNDKKLRLSMGQKSREYIQKYLSYDEISKQFVKLNHTQ